VQFQKLNHKSPIPLPHAVPKPPFCFSSAVRNQEGDQGKILKVLHRPNHSYQIQVSAVINLRCLLIYISPIISIGRELNSITIDEGLFQFELKHPDRLTSGTVTCFGFYGVGTGSIFYPSSRLVHQIFLVLIMVAGHGD
jgi:hypothetical protein